MSKLRISTRLMLLVAWLGRHGPRDANRRMHSIGEERLLATARLGRANEQRMPNRLACGATPRIDGGLT